MTGIERIAAERRRQIEESVDGLEEFDDTVRYKKDYMEKGALLYEENL
jgi:hypothetical protein